MAQKVTIRDVAKAAGVSVSAVSQVLNGKGRLSPQTRQKVDEAVEKLGYIPDSRARAMRSSHSHTVGLVVPQIRNDFFASFVSVVQDTLWRHGYATLIGSSFNDDKRQDAFLRTLLTQRIDGIICVPTAHATPGLKAALDNDVPLVFADRTIAGLDHVPRVLADPEPGLREALRDIRDHGHAKVAFIAGPTAISPTLGQRCDVFRAVAAPLFGEDNILVRAASSPAELPGLAVQDAVEFGATALLFGHSPTTLRTLPYLVAAGIEPGRDMSIVSFNEIQTFSVYRPRINVISEQVAVMGETAALEMLTLVEHADAADSSATSRGSVRPGTPGSVPASAALPVPATRLITTLYIARDSVCAAPARAV